MSSLNEEQIEAAKNLLLTIDVINETVGDAISDMLLVEAILLDSGWDVRDWFNTYVDLPNLQKKISVADRSVITTTDAERKCVTPEGLQDEIDKAVAKYPRGRSFVRASGTEDIVRVYAEAASKEVRESRDDDFNFINEFLFIYFNRTLKIWQPRFHHSFTGWQAAWEPNQRYQIT